MKFNKKISIFCLFTSLVMILVISKGSSIVSQEESLVPWDNIITELPKDKIPSLDTPKYISAAEFESNFTEGYLENVSVFGIVIDGEVRAYPWDILIWHEIVNDEINGKPFSVTFCPLTGTGLLFNRSAISGSTIGVSGKLYENNLVFYDRESDTHWSQVLNLAIYGEKIGQKLKLEPIVETTWKVWKVLHPDTKVLSRDSSSERFQRFYNYNLYGDYRDVDTIWFKTTYNATLAPYNKYFAKALNLVIGTDASKIKLYPFEELGKKSVLNEKQENKPFVIFFDKINQLVIPYDSTIHSSLTDETVLKFNLVNETEFGLNPSQTFSMAVFQDQTGTIWNMLGQAIHGTLEGEKLEQIPSFNAFWFAATAFFPEATVYPTGNNNTTGIDFLILLPINFAGLTVYIIRKKVRKRKRK